MELRLCFMALVINIGLVAFQIKKVFNLIYAAVFLYLSSFIIFLRLE